VITHLDELEYVRRERGHLVAEWGSLTGWETQICGAHRIRIDPGRWSTPAHVEGSEEELFYVLAGSGISWQDGHCYDVGPGDCLFHAPGREAHTLRAGDEGLDVLVFGHRHLVASAHLPRSGVSWLGPSWTRGGAAEDHPWALEAAAGAPELGEPEPRPASIVHLDAAEPGGYDRRVERKALGRTAGARRSGLNWVRLGPGEEGPPPHCHSAEEEVFVLLDGGGALELLPSPARAATGATPEEHELRAGHVVVRAAGTGIAHLLRAGEQGLTYLVYGTKEPNDICYYPRSNKVALRGIGLIGRIEPLDYFDGEPR
jgi:uncharacterized cupin superfamily protein